MDECDPDTSRSLLPVHALSNYLFSSDKIDDSGQSLTGKVPLIALKEVKFDFILTMVSYTFPYVHVISYPSCIGYTVTFIFIFPAASA